MTNAYDIKVNIDLPNDKLVFRMLHTKQPFLDLYDGRPYDFTVTIVTGSMSLVPCWENHGNEIPYPMNRNAACRRNQRLAS